MGLERFETTDVATYDANAAIRAARGVVAIAGGKVKEVDAAGSAIDGVNVGGGVTAAGDTVGILDTKFPLVETGEAYDDRAALTTDAQGRFVTAKAGDWIDADATESSPASGKRRQVKLRSKAQARAGHVITSRVATTTPVTFDALNDEVIVVRLAVAGAVAVNLPAGRKDMHALIVDGTGDANTNNITINRNGTDLIAGATTKVINTARGRAELLFDGVEWVVIG
ncbi:MAG TPA: hypothetical protein VF787_24525 [Thermoanaerobaculia bacterium]